ncbi:MAG: 30S ribosomal protein S18 [Chloroflexi bacterium]|nr:30S ribosomal protein S18 [Chloroflexota bacterium]
MTTETSSSPAPAAAPAARPAAPGAPRTGGPGGAPRPGGGGRPPFRGGGGGQGGFQRRRGRPRYYARRKICTFCVDKVKYIDYKDVPRLRRFLSDRYKMEARRKTGVCAKHQRALSRAVKRARVLALIPFSPDHKMPGGGYAA